LPFFLLTIHYYIYGQNATINQLNEKGQKTGIWIVYLDKDWKEVKDTGKAVCKFYDRYLNGNSNYFFLGKHSHFEHPLKGYIDTNTKFLNGEYKELDKKGRLKEFYVFKNGEIVFDTQYNSDGTLKDYRDYNIAFDNNLYSHALYVYQKNGITRFYIYKHGNWGWTYYEWDKADQKIVTKTK